MLAATYELLKTPPPIIHITEIPESLRIIECINDDRLAALYADLDAMLRMANAAACDIRLALRQDAMPNLIKRAFHACETTPPENSWPAKFIDWDLAAAAMTDYALVTEVVGARYVLVEKPTVLDFS